MDRPVLLCTDGSPAALAALRAGLEVVDPAAPLVLVTASEPPDVTLVTGTGMAGGVMTEEAYDTMVAAEGDAARAALTETAAALGLSGADTHLVHGDAGTAICALAESLDARAIVMGTRGRGGLRRAVLGSVSDHVIRNAPCTVLVSGGQVGLDD